MPTEKIKPDSNQLFAAAVVTTNSTSFAFRSDSTRNEFNKLATWIKGRIGLGSIVLQALKPEVVIESDEESDWAATGNPITVSGVFRIEFANTFYRYKVKDVGADTAIVAATRPSPGVEVNFEITTHGLEVGDKIVPRGFTPAAYNGTFVVKTVVDVDNITVDLLGDPGGDATVVGTMASTVIEPFLIKDVN